MADFDALDGRLRDALGQAAQQGDSAGVADAIRSRVAAGDAGTSVAGGTAPGWGGGAWSWLPWLATVLVAGIVGTTLGLTGVFGVPTEQVSVLPSTASVVEVAPAYSCPGGPRVGQLRGGDRVVAVQRSDDSAYLGVRDPWNVTTTLWVATSAVVVDAGQPAISTLPVGGCPEATVQYGDPVLTEEPTEEPAPPAPRDTTPPVVSQGSASTPFYAANGVPTTVTATASDDRAVQRIDVAITWPDGTTATGQMQNAGGGTWTFSYSTGGGSPTGIYRFVLTAVDAAGNSSAPFEVKVQSS